jgi:hypothetical protein
VSDSTSRRATRRVARRGAGSLLAAVAACLALPLAAQAHGPVDPAASHWQARITHVPAGLSARAVDGDLRLWLRASPRLTVEVLDYNRAPYLRFSPAGVFVNRNSAMWYVNESPPVTPPLSLKATTPPSWQLVSSGDSYLWQDGRLQALSRTVLPAGSDDAGRWSVPLRIDGRAAAIGGDLLHRRDPSPVWFWPILVALACVLAGLRLRRPALDRRMAAGLAGLALAGFVVASVGHQLHGRPDVTVGQLIVLGLELAFTAWGVAWLARGRHTWLTLFIVAGVVLWQGISLAGTLTDGYVLLATGTVLGRLSEIACLAGGAGLLPIVFVMAERAGIGRGRSGPHGGESDQTPSPVVSAGA